MVSFTALAEKDLHHFIVPSYLQRNQSSGWEQAGDHTKPLVLGFGMRLEPIMQKLKENTRLGSDAESSWQILKWWRYWGDRRIRGAFVKPLDQTSVFE